MAKINFGMEVPDPTMVASVLARLNNFSLANNLRVEQAFNMMWSASLEDISVETLETVLDLAADCGLLISMVSQPRTA